MRSIPLAVAGLLACTPLLVCAQQPETSPPVIDVHVHAPMSPGAVEASIPRLHEMLGVMDSLNVRFAVLTGVPDVLFAWTDEIGDRIGVLPSLLFPCENGVTVMWGRPCFEGGEDWPDIDRLRNDVESGRIQALGEITTQFLGLGPSDDALDPYFALAAEYDLPLFIHMGPGAPAGGYEETPTDLPTPSYRATAGNPLLLKDALQKYPDVRVAVMHSGWPLADEMVFTLYQHPQVYAEIGLLHVTGFFPREEYHAFLGRLVRAGFADRILFGSDGNVAEGIAAIREADYLSEAQKRDILCNNAARFLRLGEEICR